MRLTLLGTGSAAQMPVYNCFCPACRRARQNPRHRRGSCCALVETASQRWLVDSGLTDLASRFEPGVLSGIFQTHYHADHAQGLLQLRWGVGTRIAVLGPDDPDMLADLRKHPGILDFSHRLTAFEAVEFEGLRVIPVALNHSRPTLGYVFESGSARLAYLTDTVGLPDETSAFLSARPLDVLVMDCSHPPQPTPPRNHNDLTTALEIVKRLPVTKTVLTHVDHSFEAWLMANPGSLPDNVVVAQDGDVLDSATFG